MYFYYISIKVHIFWEGHKISIVDLSYVVPVKSMVEISQNFLAFSKYKNFTEFCELLVKCFDNLRGKYDTRNRRRGSMPHSILLKF